MNVFFFDLLKRELDDDLKEAVWPGMEPEDLWSVLAVQQIRLQRDLAGKLESMAGRPL